MRASGSVSTPASTSVRPHRHRQRSGWRHACARAGSRDGARILIVERGESVPSEPDNWNPEAVWKHLRYRTTERWLDAQGRSFRPYTHYNVGGNTKFWAAC